MELQPLKLQPLPIDLSIMMKQVVDYYKIISRNKGIPLHLDIRPTVPKFFLGDELRLKQVLYNLIGNAIKFTEKGEITMGVDFVRQLGRPVLEFKVTDSGIGIPSNRQSVIFEPFKQADEVNRIFLEFSFLLIFLYKDSN